MATGMTIVMLQAIKVVRMINFTCHSDNFLYHLFGKNATKQGDCSQKLYLVPTNIMYQVLNRTTEFCRRHVIKVPTLLYNKIKSAKTFIPLFSLKKIVYL
jgi:hypothetical protein